MFPEDYVRVYSHNGAGERTEEYYVTEERYAEEGADFEPLVDPTLDEVIEHLERRAESDNYHSLGGIYGWLGTEIALVAGEEKARDIMLKVLNEWSGFMV
jgi:hypothetical protein